jgi:hypothetical protein
VVCAPRSGNSTSSWQCLHIASGPDLINCGLQESEVCTNGACQTVANEFIVFQKGADPCPQ